MEIRERVISLVNAIGDLDESLGVYDTNIMLDDYGFDSIKTLELVVAIEDEFGITIEDEDLVIEKLNDLDEIVKLIAKAH